MASDTLQDTTDTSFDQDVLAAAAKPVIVDFWATWCGPCRAMQPHLQKVADEHADKAGFYKLNIENSPETAKKYQVTSIPTLLVFKDGEVVDKMMGNPGPKKLRDFVEKHIG